MGVKKIKYLVRIWFSFAKIAAQSQLLTEKGGILFLTGKIVRFLFFFLFFHSVLSQTGSLLNYSPAEVVFFFLVFNLVDIGLQFLFRGVYVFRPLVVSGNYDLDLLKPLPSWFRPLFGWTDIFDLITLIPLIVFVIFYIFSEKIFVSWGNFFLFLILLGNSFLLGFAFHLFVCAVCVLTTKIDHLIWVYRDVVAMARFPTDIYRREVRLFLTFVIPVVILITVPAKAFLGVLSGKLILFSLGVGVGSVFLAVKFWFWALRHYTSASS